MTGDECGELLESLFTKISYLNSKAAINRFGVFLISLVTEIAIQTLQTRPDSSGMVAVETHGRVSEQCATIRTDSGTMLYDEAIHRSLLKQINFFSGMNNEHVLLIQCPDAKGLIFNISKVIFDNQLNIVRNAEYVDFENNQFFFRSELEGEVDKAQILKELTFVLPDGAHIELRRRRKKRIVVLVTKEHHCIGDLLLRHHYGTMNATIEGVIGNHDVLEELVSKYQIPYYAIPTKGLTREEHEVEVMRKMELFKFDYVVLAKYMRILTPNFVKTYERKVINIHHSFLPAFIGANPYRQAYNRGVKIIGATAHFVTDNLDEGPIIHQDIIRVNHTLNAKAMALAGRDVERSVFSKALEWVFTERVMINGNKTIIF